MGAPGSGGTPKAVSLDLLQPGFSPRVCQDEEHIHLLAQTDNTLPPILVHWPSMRIIDGVHRHQAAKLRGQQEVTVVFFNGSEEDAFIRAVQENIAHGLPLSLADRKAAAARIIASHPDLSDRAIASHTGLATKTVAALRHRSAGDSPQSNARRGLDGRTRPMNAAEGRRRAAEAMDRHPGASLRQIARIAGVSLGTAHDVRWRLRRGEDPVPTGSTGRLRPDGGGAVRAQAPVPAEVDAGAAARDSGVDHQALLRKLSRDPALRQTDLGRRLLRLLHESSVSTHDWDALIDSVPPHCAGIAARIAQQYTENWGLLARALERRENQLP